MKNKEIELKKFEDEYMIKVKGGKYKPSFEDMEKIVFDIEVSKYLVTKKMWFDVMGTISSEAKGDNEPAENITWWEALEFCNKLSEKYSLEPVYDLSKSKQGLLTIKELKGKTVNPKMANFKNTEGFRLPTEIEWEWFARGGQIAIEQGTFDYKYSGSDNIDEVAWYAENSNYLIQNVGLKKSNQLGLFDCSGNIWEWCYDTEEMENIKSLNFNFDPSSAYRRLRGGAWLHTAESCTTLYRTFEVAAYIVMNTGFRIVRTI